MKEFKFKCIEDNIGLEEDKKEIVVEGNSFDNDALALFMIEGGFCVNSGKTDPSKIIVHEEYFDNEEDYAIFKLVNMKKTQ